MISHPLAIINHSKELLTLHLPKLIWLNVSLNMALVTVFELFPQMRQIFVFVLSDPIIDAILQLERLMDGFEDSQFEF